MWKQQLVFTLAAGFFFFSLNISAILFEKVLAHTKWAKGPGGQDFRNAFFNKTGNLFWLSWIPVLVFAILLVITARWAF